MTQPRRRKFFQIHLSTAIVLMFVAGGLMWLIRFNKPRFGWPLHVIVWVPNNGKPSVSFTTFSFEFEYSYSNALLDLAVFIGILFIVWLICERRIRRKG